MSQYIAGTVNVTSGSATVVGVNTNWMSNVQPGQLFNIYGSLVLYQVASVTSNTELQLTAPYAGVTSSDLGYAITRDFTPNRNLPIINPGDMNAMALINRAMAILDQL